MNIQEAGRALRARAVSSVELTEAAIQKIEELNPKLNAFLTVTAETAREQARQADDELAAGVDRGALHGIPVALKDVFCTKGVRTTLGSRPLADFVPEYDATVAVKLREAGGVMLGKTAMHEFAYGITSTNPHYGPVRNPANPECIPGGSSGGSGAAVASGMVFAALGSDTGGSIRVPASFCGTVGLKPTSGRVSRYGVLPLDYTLDHIGPLTRTVRDAGLVLNAIAGWDEKDPTSSRRAVEEYCPGEVTSLAGVRIGLPKGFFFDRAQAVVREAVFQAAKRAEALGASVEWVEIPDNDQVAAAHRMILLPEASAVIGTFHARRDELGADVRALYEQGRMVSAVDYLNAQRLRGVFRAAYAALFRTVDYLFTPTTLFTAPQIGSNVVEVNGVSEDVRLLTTATVRAMNLVGYPAVSVPCGVDAGGLPIGLQVAGGPFREAGVLRVAEGVKS